MRVETMRVGGRRAELTWKSAILVGILTIFFVSLISMAVAALAAREGMSTSSAMPSQAGSIPWNGRDTLNVLVLGVDSPSPTASTAAGMLVVSYNPSTGKERVLSIPASLWVTIPGFGPDTVANTYADGGSRLALQVAETITDMPIPYYLSVGTDALRQVVDAYGGVTIRDTTFVARKNPSGARHLTGAQAISYLKAGGSGPAGDVQRIPRLQRLFLAMQRRSLQPQNLFQVAATVNAVGGSIATNFPFSQVPALAHAMSGTRHALVATAALDYSSGTVANYSANGTRVLLPDWQAIHSYARSFFHPTVPRSSLVVLNGSGAAGEAESLTHWLRQTGVHVARYGSAPTFNQAHTQVIVNSASRKSAPALARTISALVQAPIVTRAVPYSKAPIIVMIGADYQDVTQQ